MDFLYTNTFFCFEVGFLHNILFSSKKKFYFETTIDTVLLLLI